MERKSAQQRRLELAKTIERINSIIKHPQFIKFVGIYAKRFKQNRGYGRWLKEYQDADANGQFEPTALRKHYINILLNRDDINFQYKCAVYRICVLAEDAAKSYIEIRVKALYSIIVFTGELAYDDDDDPYVDLSYDEATEICKLLNEEAEEELFKIKKQ